MNNIVIVHKDETRESIEGEVYWAMSRTPDENKDPLLVAIYISPEHWRTESIKIVTCNSFHIGYTYGT